MFKLPLIILSILNMHGAPILKDQTLIESTCQNTPNYDLCVATLRGSPAIAAANDVADLGLIIVEAIRSTAQSGVTSVEKLWWRRPELRSALQRCRRSYGAVLKADVPEAVASLTKGVPKFAEFGMTDAAWEAEICEGMFETEAESPLSGLNKELHDLAEVAASIVRMLL